MPLVRNAKTFIAQCIVTMLAFIFFPLANAQNIDRITNVFPLAELVNDLDVNERGPDGSTPLQWAVYAADIDKVKNLIKAGADVNAANNYGANSMQLAAETANEEILKLLLKAGADVDSPNPEGQTALMLVARTGDIDSAKLLIKNGATIDARENWGQQTALMWASARQHPAMMELLLKNNADADARSAIRDYKRHVTAEGRAKNLDNGGLTPLLYSVRENCLPCIEILASYSADLDIADPYGISPLMLAVINSNWDIAQALIEMDVNIQQWDVFGQAALFAAVSNRNEDGFKVNNMPNENNRLDIIHSLLQAGANPNMQLFFRPAKSRFGPLSRGTSPLILASSNGDLEAIKLLLAYGAEADLPQADRVTAISALMTARTDQAQLVEALALLLDAGGNPNIMSVPHHLQRNRGGSPLHFAARTGKDQLITALIKAGADIDATDIDGLTALDYAMSRGYIGFSAKRQPPNLDLADQLRELGATLELETMPFWPNIGPPFYYPWSIFPLDPVAEEHALVPGSIDHQ